MRRRGASINENARLECCSSVRGRTVVRTLVCAGERFPDSADAIPRFSPGSLFSIVSSPAPPRGRSDVLPSAMPERGLSQSPLRPAGILPATYEVQPEVQGAPGRAFPLQGVLAHVLPADLPCRLPAEEASHQHHVLPPDGELRG